MYSDIPYTTHIYTEKEAIQFESPHLSDPTVDSWGDDDWQMLADVSSSAHTHTTHTHTHTHNLYIVVLCMMIQSRVTTD